MKIFEYIIILVYCSSCASVYYAPSKPNVSILTAKNEASVTGSYIGGIESNTYGGDLQLAYSPLQNAEVMLNGNIFRDYNEEQEYDQTIGTGRYGEFGIGYLLSLDQKKKWFIETYLGRGFGKVNHSYEEGFSSEVAIRKTFLQPSLAYKKSGFEMMFTSRLSWVHWEVKKATGILMGGDSEKILNVAAEPDFFAFEPGILFRSGVKNVKGEFGFILCKVDDQKKPALTEALVVYLGLSYRFSTKK